jgi:hypothetical protein
MKRDMDLVRAILLKIEDHPTPTVEGYLEVEGYEQGPVHHHIDLLKQAGFVDAYCAMDANTEYGFLLQDVSLTWNGHEFLGAVRDPEIWQKTKAGALKVGIWSISILAELAKGLALQKMKAMGLPIGA